MQFSQNAVIKFIVNNSILLGNIIESIKQRKLILINNIENCENNEFHLFIEKYTRYNQVLEKGHCLNELVESRNIPGTLIALGERYFYFQKDEEFYLIKKRNFFIGYDLVNICKNLDSIIINN